MLGAGAAQHVHFVVEGRTLRCGSRLGNGFRFGERRYYRCFRHRLFGRDLRLRRYFLSRVLCEFLGDDLRRASALAASANAELTGGAQSVTISLVALLLIVIIVILVA